MMAGNLTWRSFVLLAIGALLAGWLAFLPENSEQALVRVRRDDWAIVELPRPEHPGSLSVAVAAAPMWGPDPKAAAASAPPPEDLRWRLAGLYGRGKQGGAVVMFLDPAKPTQRLKVGDKLPDGRLVEAVDGNELVVRNEKKKLERVVVERQD